MKHPAALDFFKGLGVGWGAKMTDDRPRLAGFHLFFSRDGVVR
jgi:hypothetical protein